jgi:hypothetical protein
LAGAAAAREHHRDAVARLLAGLYALPGAYAAKHLRFLVENSTDDPIQPNLSPLAYPMTGQGLDSPWMCQSPNKKAHACGNIAIG